MKKIIFATLLVGLLAVSCKKLTADKSVDGNVDTIVVKDSVKTDTIKVDSVK